MAMEQDVLTRCGLSTEGSSFADNPHAPVIPTANLPLQTAIGACEVIDADMLALWQSH